MDLFEREVLGMRVAQVVEQAPAELPLQERFKVPTVH
jgi:hypothetical protein